MSTIYIGAISQFLYREARLLDDEQWDEWLGCYDPAARVADMTAFFSVEVHDDGKGRNGILVEYDATTKIFTQPADKRTEDYVTGRFG